jgi:hypothetical protein
MPIPPVTATKQTVLKPWCWVWQWWWLRSGRNTALDGIDQARDEVLVGFDGDGNFHVTSPLPFQELHTPGTAAAMRVCYISLYMI